MGTLSQTLNRTEQTLVDLEDQNSVTKTEVDSLMSDTQKLDETVQELQLQVQFIKNSNIRGKEEAQMVIISGLHLENQSLHSKKSCLQMEI